ncbi:DUF6625 family protein [Robertmurraya beringensis]|uniref:DUF6625 family protein n=1 Tax=Robertmurraya beringensis TaxID=641660 RepID=A0ABV6KS47_9BACI
MQDKYKIVIIGCYFGNLPDYFSYWLKSCSTNNHIDWIIYTDQTYPDLPENVAMINTTLGKIESLARDKLGIQAVINAPYKLCDFKPVYGKIFEDDIKDYDFWGHCDFDMIFGDISKFITNEILNKYDKVLTLGHLTLYRNTSIVNERYKDTGGEINYITALCNEEHVAFDEITINEIYKKNKYSIYDKRIFADISPSYRRFKITGKKNYENQLFLWRDGSIIHAYIDNGKIYEEEYLYIHFQKRKFNNVKKYSNDYSSFLIGPDGFNLIKNDNLETLNFSIYNPYQGKLVEKFQEKSFYYKHLFKVIKKKIKRKMK